MKNTGKTAQDIKRFILDLARAQAVRLGIRPEDALNEKVSLVDSGLFDSFGFMALLSEIEKEFSVELDLSEYEPSYFTTIDGLVLLTAELAAHVQGAVVEPIPVQVGGQSSLIEITPSQPCWKQLPALFDEMYSYFGQHGLSLSLRKGGADIWLRSLEAGIGKTTQIIGSMYDGKLTGFVQCSLKLLPGFFEKSMAGVIDHIYVRPEYRRQGIAEVLVSRAESWLCGKKMPFVELLVLSDNKLGGEFWKKTGFHTELYHMKKRLPASS